jgi:hypothetical protein
MREFPKTRSYVTGRGSRRSIAGKLSVTEIIVLDDEGNQRSQYGPGGWFGVYFWNGKEWELNAVYASRDGARKAAAQIRRRLLHSN